jgi:N-acetylglucosamine kinase-like BadF-type ATPase
MNAAQGELGLVGLVGLGIDGGGTGTRWAVVSCDGTLLGEGQVAGLSALQMTSAEGRGALQAIFASLYRAALPLTLGRPLRVCAGLTGFGAVLDSAGAGAPLTQSLAHLLAIDSDCVMLCSDIEIAYRDSFAFGPPGHGGMGYLVYAGTGSIGAWLDGDGQLHRAGGRGFLLDDGGGGFWIAREAMRLIWRREDEAPDSWRTSKLAHAVFDHVGGSGWDDSRQFLYGQQRGEIGRLALAVAACADVDPDARAILQQAGIELARLALALIARHGPRPVALAGRAATLHPAIAAAMRAALPPEIVMRQREVRSHVAAARIAAGVIPR